MCSTIYPAAYKKVVSMCVCSLFQTFCSLNPVFDEDTKSTFALDVTANDVLDVDGLILDVVDWDRGMIGKHDPLGNAKVPAKDLYSNVDWEQPKEYKLSPPKGKEDVTDAGYVKVRFRIASEDDIKKYKQGFLKGSATKFLQTPSKIVAKVCKFLKKNRALWWELIAGLEGELFFFNFDRLLRK